jgi:hypothetical protein
MPRKEQDDVRMLGRSARQLLRNYLTHDSGGARNDDRDHRHQPRLPPSLDLSSERAFPESASRDRRARDPDG